MELLTQSFPTTASGKAQTSQFRAGTGRRKARLGVGGRRNDGCLAGQGKDHFLFFDGQRRSDRSMAPLFEETKAHR